MQCNKTERCLNCHEHFEQMFPRVKEVLKTKHFIKDAPDFDIGLVVGCQHEHFVRLHKFEEKIKDIYIFRALREKQHIVYAIKGDKLVFLRAFKNFKEYGKFLNNKKEIMGMI